MPSRPKATTSDQARGGGGAAATDLFEGVAGGQDQEVDVQEEEEEEEEEEDEELAGGSINMQDGTTNSRIQNGDGNGQAELEGQEAAAGYLQEQNPQDGDMYDSDSPSDSGTDSLTWITWFCSLPGHEYFAEVTEDFIEDDFNLTGLNALVPFYKEALEMVLDVEPQEDSLKIPDVSIVESSAELLYGLIHQRYILTRQGLAQMVEKYEAGHFGYCPRVFCHSHPVLPCGRSDLPGLDTVKLFCPNCIDNYAPPSSRFHGVDGAFFGTTFPHLLFQCYRDLAPSPIAAPGSYYSSVNLRPPSSSNRASKDDDEEDESSTTTTLPPPTMRPDQLGLKPSQARLYVPRIYGFRVSEQAKSGPRMRWMRMRPENFQELESGAPPGKLAKVENDGEEVDEEEEEDRGPL